MKSRIIKTNTTINTRDLGGLKTVDGNYTNFDVFIRTDNICINDDAFYTIVQLIDKNRVKHVIDLRAQAEIDKEPSIATLFKNIKYHNISLINFMPLGKGVPLGYNYNNLSQWYIEILEKSKDEIKQIINLIASIKKGTILFNCTIGKDRTSIISFILLMIAGVDPKEIAKDHNISAENVVSFYAPYLHSLSNDQLVFTSVKYEDAIKTINYINEKYMGVYSYLLSCGVSLDNINFIKRRLTK